MRKQYYCCFVLIIVIVLSCGCTKKVDTTKTVSATKVVNKDDILNKTYTYEKGGFSSHLGFGKWEIDGSRIIITEDFASSPRKNIFNVEDSKLIWVEKGSNNFIYITLKNDAVFYSK